MNRGPKTAGKEKIRMCEMLLLKSKSFILQGAPEESVAGIKAEGGHMQGPPVGRLLGLLWWPGGNKWR